MGKLGKLFKAFGLIAKKPYLLNNIIDDNDVWKGKVHKTYGIKDGLEEIRFADLAKGEEITVKPFAFLEGGSLPTDMMLLAGLAEGIDGCRYFEIGTWRGESISIVAEKAKSCHTLCLTDQQMRDMGMHEKTIASHRMFSKERL